MYAGDELYAALMEYKAVTKRPIYAYFADLAASGGYYVAMAADEIYANRLCTTGSIGVTYGTHIDLSGLCEKLGISTEELTSGDNKAMGSYFAPLTDEQKAIYQAILEEYEGYFIDVIEEGRGMERAKIEKIADGRIFTAKQALGLGLIDGIGAYKDYKAKIENEFKNGVNFEDISYTADYTEVLSSYISTLSSLPSSEIAAVLATIKPLSGPLAYYSGH
jgi:protease-4